MVYHGQAQDTPSARPKKPRTRAVRVDVTQSQDLEALRHSLIAAHVRAADSDAYYADSQPI